jgi:hypothetical protein
MNNHTTFQYFDEKERYLGVFYREWKVGRKTGRSMKTCMQCNLFSEQDRDQDFDKEHFIAVRKTTKKNDIGPTVILGVLFKCVSDPNDLLNSNLHRSVKSPRSILSYRQEIDQGHERMHGHQPMLTYTNVRQL